MVKNILDGTSENAVNKLNFYKARLYKDLGAKDNRLQVRILPEMIDIPTNEEDNLPKFPPFFSNQVYKGKTEKEFGKDAADIVGVIATPDFNYGFILGPVNLMEGNTSQKMSNTYAFSDIKSYLNQVQALPSNFNSDSIVVQNFSVYVDENSKNQDEYSLVELFNYKTGDKVIMLTSGVVFVLSKNKIFMRAGVGDSNPMGGKQFSSISVEPNQIKISTPLFQIDADQVKLGQEGYHLVGTLGTVIPTNVGGMPLVGLNNTLS